MCRYRELRELREPAWPDALWTDAASAVTTLIALIMFIITQAVIILSPVHLPLIAAMVTAMVITAVVAVNSREVMRL